MVERIARRVGVTEGQLWTFAVAMVVVLVATVTGLPPVGDNRDVATATPRTAREVASPDVVGAPPAPTPTQVPPRPIPIARPPMGPVPPATGAVGRPTTPPLSTARPPEPAFGTATAFASLEGDAVMAVAADDVGALALVAVGDGAVIVTLSSTGAAETTTLLDGDARAVAVDRDRTLVTAGAPARVASVDPATGALRTLVELPDLRPCFLELAGGPCEPGLTDDPPSAGALTVHPVLGPLVADPAQAAIWAIADDGAELLVAADALDGLPGSGIAGLGVTPSGDVIATVGARLADGGNGAVVLVEIEDGALAATRVLATTASDDPPAGVAVGRSGNAYVALPATDRVVVLHPSGEVRGALPASGATVSAPRVLTFLGSTLLASSAPPEGPALVRIHVGEQGVVQ